MTDTQSKPRFGRLGRMLPILAALMAPTSERTDMNAPSVSTPVYPGGIGYSGYDSMPTRHPKRSPRYDVRMKIRRKNIKLHPAGARRR